MSAGFLIELVDGLLVARCEALSRISGIAHAFSTRKADGRNDFDLGPAGAAGEDLARRRLRFVAAAGLRGAPVVLNQVHGARVVRSFETAGRVGADAVLWLESDPVDWVPAVRTADCVPILVADRRSRAVGAAHAGWRGVAAGMGAALVRALAVATSPVEIEVALGPAIGPCCYEVDEEVAQAVIASAGPAADIALPTGRDQKYRLDLRGAIRHQLERAGVPRGAIHSAPWCTRCREDLFHSHRRDGRRAGRMMACVGVVASGSQVGAIRARP